MSIYGSTLDFSATDHTDECAIWDKSDPECWETSGVPCSCGTPNAPLAYQGSHVLPSDDDQRSGAFGFAEIPGHITRAGRDEQPDPAVPWPWLRVHLDGDEGTNKVLINARQAQAIHEYLGDWLVRAASNHAGRVLFRKCICGTISTGVQCGCGHSLSGSPAVPIERIDELLDGNLPEVRSIGGPGA